MLYKARFIVCIDSAVKYQTRFGAFNCIIDTGKVQDIATTAMQFTCDMNHKNA